MYLYIEKTNGIVRLLPNPDAEISLAGIRVREENFYWYNIKECAFRTQYENETRLCEDLQYIATHYQDLLREALAIYSTILKAHEEMSFNGYTITPYTDDDHQKRYRIVKGEHHVGNPISSYLWDVLVSLLPLED